MGRSLAWSEIPKDESALPETSTLLVVKETEVWRPLPTIYYRSKYNKHARTDKIVRHILHKYHNIHIPKLTKAYCNTTKLHTMLLTNKLLHSKIINS